MKRNIFLTLLLAAALTLGTLPAFAASEFTDVEANAFYAEAVDWAVNKAITNGKGGGLFAPADTVTRAEAVTFLWRMEGCPAPTQTETFIDVESDANSAWYKTAVQWAVEQKVTNGTGNGLFSPTVPCTRGMILTMLYRAQGCPFDAAMAAEIPESPLDLGDVGNALIRAMVEGTRSGNSFSDVKEGDYFELPVIWAMMNSILGVNQIKTDAASVAVEPNTPCPRGEMVYFLYHASGDAPDPALAGAVQTGTIPETVVFDQKGVKITATGIESVGLNDAQVFCTIVNGSDKTLRLDMNECFVNTYVCSAQVSDPVTDEDGFTFYSDAIVKPGETKDFLVLLNSIGDMGIDRLGELEMKFELVEVSAVDGDYYYMGDFATGELVNIHTSLYAEDAYYDWEGTSVYDKDGLTVLVAKAQNDDFSGPQIGVYVHNTGTETVLLELAELKLDGESMEAFWSVRVPAGKRCMEQVYVFYDYDNVPMPAEAELTLQMVDDMTMDVVKTFDPVRLTMQNQ